MLLLSSDGLVTIVNIEPRQRIWNLAKDRVRLPDTSHLTISRIHIIKNNLLVAVSTIGTVNIFEACEDINPVECGSKPPKLGPTSSAVSESSVVLLRAVDSFTSQLFQINFLDYSSAFELKMKEGLYDSAIEIAKKINIDVDIVLKQQFTDKVGASRRLPTDSEALNVPQILAESACVSTFADDLTAILDRITDKTWVLEQINAYEDANYCNVASLLSYGVNLCQAMDDGPPRDYRDDGRRDDSHFHSLLQSKLHKLTILKLMVELLMQQHKQKYQRNVTVAPHLALFKAHTVSAVDMGKLNGDEYAKIQSLRGQAVSDEEQELDEATINSMVILDMEKIRRSIMSRKKHPIVVCFLRMDIVLLAQYLIRQRCETPLKSSSAIITLRLLLQLFGDIIGQHYMSLLAELPASCDVSLYETLLPIEVGDDHNFCIHVVSTDGSISYSAIPHIQRHRVFQHLLYRVFLLDTLGLSSAAQDLIQVCIRWCDRCGESRLEHYKTFKSIINEVDTIFHHYCFLLYRGLLPADETVLTFMGRPINELLSTIFVQYMNSSSKIPLAVLISTHIKSMYQRQHDNIHCRLYEKMDVLQLLHLLYSIIAPSEVCVAQNTFLCSNIAASMKIAINMVAAYPKNLILDFFSRQDSCTDTIADIDLLWELTIVQSLYRLVTRADINILNHILTVCAASIPKFPKATRCIQSIPCLVLLVIESSYRYDDIDSGEEVMWNLIETTPTQFQEFPDTISGEVRIDRLYARDDKTPSLNDELDFIQSSLHVTEILRHYSVPIPSFAQWKHGDDNINHEQRKFILHLIQGCGSLVSLTAGSNQLSLLQALVTKIAYQCSNLFSQNPGFTWVKLAADVRSVLEYKGSRKGSGTQSWVGVLLVHTMILQIPSEECGECFQDIINLQVKDSDPNNWQISNYLQQFGVSADTVIGIIVERAREITNSCATLDDPSLNEVGVLLTLIPPLHPHHPYFSAVKTETSMLQVIKLLSITKSELLPLQLRFKTALEVIDSVEFQPAATCYQFNQAEFTKHRRETAILEKEVYIARRNLLSKQDIGGKFLSVIEVLNGDMITVTTKLLIKFIFMYKTLNDYESLYCCGLELLKLLQNSSINEAQRRYVVQHIYDVFEGMTQCNGKHPGVTDFSLFLQSHLKMQLLICCPVNLLAVSGTLDSSVPPKLFSTPSDIAKGAITALLDEVVHNKNPSRPNENDCWQLSSAHHKFSDALGYLLLVDDRNEAISLLDSFSFSMNELVDCSRLNIVTHNPRPNKKIDDEIVKKLTLMGYSLHASRRAACNTNSVSLPVAIKWIVEHSNDPELDQPFHLKVPGAVKPDGKENIIDPYLIQEALKLISVLQTSYLDHHDNNSTIQTSETSCLISNQNLQSDNLNSETNNEAEEERLRIAAMEAARLAKEAEEERLRIAVMEAARLAEEAEEERLRIAAMEEARLAKEAEEERLRIAAMEDARLAKEAEEERLRIAVMEAARLAKEAEEERLRIAAMEDARLAMEIVGNSIGVMTPRDFTTVANITLLSSLFASVADMLDFDIDGGGLALNVVNIHSDSFYDSIDKVYDVVVLLSGSAVDNVLDVIKQILSCLPDAAIRGIHERLSALTGISEVSGNIEADNCLLLFAVARLQCICLEDLSSSIEPIIPIFMSDTALSINVLHTLYQDIRGTNLTVIDSLKKLAIECFTTMLTASNSCAVRSILSIPLSCSSDQVNATAQNVVKLLKEDQAILKRVLRISNHAGINGKNLLKLHTLYPTYDENKLPEPEASARKFAALEEIRPFLNANNISSWHRAVGRVFDIAINEMHIQYALCYVTNIQRMYYIDQPSVDEESAKLIHHNLTLELTTIVKKLDPEDVESMCSMLCGIHMHQLQHSQCIDAITSTLDVTNQLIGFFLAAVRNVLLSYESNASYNNVIMLTKLLLDYNQLVDILPTSHRLKAYHALVDEAAFTAFMDELMTNASLLKVHTSRFYAESTAIIQQYRKNSYLYAAGDTASHHDHSLSSLLRESLDNSLHNYFIGDESKYANFFVIADEDRVLLSRIKQMKELPRDLAHTVCTHLLARLWSELEKEPLHERQHVDFDNLTLVYKKRLHGLTLVATEISLDWVTHQQHGGDAIVTALLTKSILMLIILAIYSGPDNSEMRLIQEACDYCMNKLPTLLVSNVGSINVKLEIFTFLFNSFSDLQLLRDTDDNPYNTEDTIELFVALMRLFSFSKYSSIDNALTHVTTQVRLLMVNAYDASDKYVMSKEIYNCWNEVINACLENKLYNHIITILLVDVPIKCLQQYPNSILSYLNPVNCSANVMLQLFRHHLSILTGYMDQIVEEIELDDESDSLIVDDTTLLLLLLDPTLNMSAIRETKIFQYIMHFIVSINRVRESNHNVEAAAPAGSSSAHTLDTYITKKLRFKLPFLMSNISIIMRLISDDLLLEGLELYCTTHLDSRLDGYDLEEIMELILHALCRPMNIPYTYPEAKSDCNGWEEYSNYCKVIYKKLLEKLLD